MSLCMSATLCTRLAPKKHSMSNCRGTYELISPFHSGAMSLPEPLLEACRRQHLMSLLPNVRGMNAEKAGWNRERSNVRRWGAGWRQIPFRPTLLTEKPKPNAQTQCTLIYAGWKNTVSLHKSF